MGNSSRSQAWWAFAMMAAAAAADQLTVSGKNYANARIITLEAGRVEFRAGDGALLTAWLDEVDSLQVDRGGAFADINEAERLVAKGEIDNALVRYRRAARISEGFWGDLTDARILRACSRPEHIDQAALAFVKVARGKTTGAGPAVRLTPRRLPETRDPKVSAAIDTLENALIRDPAEDQRTACELFRFGILHGIGDARGDSAAQTVLSRPLPLSAKGDRAYALILDALKRATSSGANAKELASLDDFIRDCPASLLAEGLLLKGEILLQSASNPEEIIRASWPFLRVALQMSDDPRAADGFYGASIALERVGRVDKCIELLRECVAHRRVTAGTRKRAEVALARLQPKGSPTPK